MTGDEADGRGTESGLGLNWRDGLIALLLILFVALSGWSVAGRPGERAKSEVVASPEAAAFSVFEVLADRDERKTIEILFDRPAVSEAFVGKVLTSPPATLSPSLPGVWRWTTESSLRFEASGRIPVASDLSVALIPSRLAADGREFSGKREFRVTFDRFLVEDVQVEEDMSPEGDGRVVLTGWIRFNYAVEPDLLASRIRIEDPDGDRGSPPEVLLESTWAQPTLRFRTGPLAKRDRPRELRLIVAGDLVSVEGNAPLGGDYEARLPLGGRGNLAVRRIEPRPGLDKSTLYVTFTSPVSAEIAAQYVRVEPEVDFELAAERNVLRLVGDFAPGSAYRFLIDPGLPADDAAVLGAEVSREIRFPDLPASVAFAADGMFLSRSGYRNLAVDTVNVSELRLVVDRVYPNNLAILFQHHGYGSGFGWIGSSLWRPLGDRLVDETIAVTGKRNRLSTTILSLAEHVDLDRSGLYRVMLGQPENWEAPQRWILVTDLGVVAKRGPDELVVWALSSRTLRPAAGAEIEVLSDKNQSLGKGRADGAGFWRLRDYAALDAGEPFLVVVRQGDDFGFLHLDRMRIDTSGLDVAGASVGATGYSAYVYGERDLYRPGETLRGVALVRDRDLRPAPPMPVLVRHRTPDGREVATRRLEIDPRGLIELEWEVSPVAPTGSHSLELEIAEQRVGLYRFQVEEFVPDRIKVEIEPETTSVMGGEGLAGRVAAEYLFGAPGAGLRAETRVRLEDATFSSPSHPQFVFRASDRSFKTREVFSESDHLDEEGVRRFALEIPRERPPSALTAVITSRVQEAGGRGVTGQLRLPVHPVPSYVGLRRTAEGYPEPNEEVELEYVTVSPDGEEVASGELVAELVIERWQTVLRRTPNGNFRYESVREPRVVDSLTLSAGPSRARFRFTPREYGRHRVVVRDSAGGAAADVSFYVSGWGYSAWAIDNPARLELDLDRDEYGAGDTAILQVRAPFAGKLWLTVEGDRVLDSQVYVLDGNTATLEVPIRRAYRPNVYLTATLVRGVEELEPGGVARAFGAIPLNVERRRNRLEMALDTRAETRSGTALEVAVKTAPGAAVTLAAVDEGILQLIAQKTADPFAFFYRKLALGVSSADTFNLLLPEVAASEAGGGVGALRTQYVRTEGIRRVQPVAFWSGVVEADRRGMAHARFELPEFQGALRVMAVAADGARFGSTDGLVRVRDPLVLTPTLPRVLSFGERLEVPVVLRNDTGLAGRFRLDLAVEGTAEVAATAASVELDVAPGRQATHYFQVDTGAAAGAARFVFTAQGNGESARASAEVPVRADLPPATELAAGSLTERETRFAAVEGVRYRPGVERRLTIGSFPLVRFGGRLSELLRYPYGCLEQTVSRAFPLVYLGDLAAEIGVDLVNRRTGARDPSDFVERALTRVAMHQVAGGGLGLWPGANRPDPWTGAYATHFLVEAEKAGYAVDRQLLERSLDFLARGVKAKASYGEVELERLAYWLYVLARAGHADLGTMDFLRARHADRLRPESKALLAAAYAALGHRDAVEELLARVGEIERIERQTGGNLRSSLRSRAMLLLAYLDAAPDDPRIATLAERLAREASAVTRWTTQEGAFTFLALGQLAHRQRQSGEYAGGVWVGRRRIGSFTSAETAVFAGLPGDARIEVRLDRGYSPGAAFYQLETRGVPADDAYQPSANGLQIERRFWDRRHRRVDLANLRQGDLVVIETRVRTTAGRVDNVVVETLLPAGLEIENPRLETTEDLPWVSDGGQRPDHLDLRDDRILVFTGLENASWRRFYSLARAVVPGTFRLPPPHAEAMYNPSLRATGQRGWLIVKTPDGQ